MSEKPYFEPAHSIISRFGSAAEVGRILDLDKSTVTRWTMAKPQKGTEGKIPRKYWEPLMVEAKKRKIRLTITQLAALNK